MNPLRAVSFASLSLIAFTTGAGGQPVPDAQTSRRMPAAPSCVSCRIVVEPVAAITHDIISSRRSMNGYAVMDSRGRIYLTSDARLWQVDVFDPRGRHLYSVGRKGSGPGEFRMITSLVIDAADSLHVIDDANGRHVVYAHGASNPSRTGRWTPSSLGTLSLVAAGRYAGAFAQQVPEPRVPAITIVDDSGKHVVGLAHRPGRSAIRDFQELRRHFTPDGSGGLFSVRAAEFRIEHWNGRGTLIEALTASLPILPPIDFSRYQPLDRKTPRPNYIAGISRDDNGLLWMLVRVRDAKWKNALTVVRDEGGRQMLGVEEYDRYDDTIILVVDPAAGRILASHRVDPAYIRFLRPGYVMSTTDEPEPTVSVWRLRLVR